ncbi:MAG: hypothetical protein OXG58_06715 [Gemmatimonadetes bacterium]|nr:hypothetical protein [Gemmatimonadota bacterium]
MSLLPLRPLRFGEIVDGTLQLYRRDFGLYYLAALLAAVGSHLLLQATGIDQVPLPVGDETDPFAAMANVLPDMGTMLVGALAASAIHSVGAIAVCSAMTERIAERPATVAGSYLTALGRLPSVWGALLLAGLIGLACIGALALAVGIVTALASAIGGILGLALAGSAGTALLFAATAFLFGAFFGILPAAVSEGRGPLGALGRSLDLFRAGWLRVTGVMAVAMIVATVPSVAIVGLMGVGGAFAAPEAAGQVSSVGMWLSGIASLAFGALTLPFTVGSAMVLFHDQRVRTEGYDLEARAREMGGD